MTAPAPVDEARQEEHRAERSAPSALLRAGVQRYAPQRGYNHIAADAAPRLDPRVLLRYARG